MFGRKIDSRVFTFGVSGLLRDANLIMWDHETESWWQQGTYEAIVGTMTGTRLPPIPSQVVSWQDFKEAHPGALVLSRNSYEDYRDQDVYGYNPYYHLDTRNSIPFSFFGDYDERLRPTERVVGLKMGGRTVAYPFPLLNERLVVYDTLGDREIVILFKRDTRSVLDDNDISLGRLVGTANVYRPLVDGRRVTLTPSGDGLFTDRETGSRWSVFGVATEGQLKGKRLPQLFSTSGFWFYWAAANRGTEIFQ